jgi:hypothetical protein
MDGGDRFTPRLEKQVITFPYFVDVNVEAGEKFLQGFSKRC